MRRGVWGGVCMYVCMYVLAQTEFDGEIVAEEEV